MIIKAKRRDAATAAALAGALWPGHSLEELEQELAQLMEQQEAAVFLAMEGERAVGFAQCQLRHDYVEGTETSPVGYLEGIYVPPDHRGQGIASALLASCEAWAEKMGCKEFASDCELTNLNSLAFHTKLGFREVNRIICFVKKL